MEALIDSPTCAEHKIACYQEWICPQCIDAVEVDAKMSEYAWFSLGVIVGVIGSIAVGLLVLRG